MKYTDDLVLVTKEEMALQGMTNRLIEFGRCDRMAVNVQTIKVINISRQPYTLQIMTDRKQQKMQNISTT